MPFLALCAGYDNSSLLHQEARVENAFIHPNWTGDVVDGYDAAILRLPRPFSIKTPSLSSQNYNVYPNHKAHILNLDKVVETAELFVVENKLCPHLNNLSSDIFCIYSQTTPPCQSMRIEHFDKYTFSFLVTAH